MIRRFTLILLLLPALAWSQGLYEHPESKLQFPPRLGGLERVKIHRYDDPRLGVAVSYARGETIKADIFVFDYGKGPIADGLDSELVKAAYAGADRDIAAQVAAGRYTDFEQMVPLGAAMNIGPQKTPWYVAAYRFRMLPPGNDPLASWLLVRGFKGQFVKVRMTHSTVELKDGRNTASGFVEALMEANP